MTVSHRPAARPARAELLVLQKAEDSAAWLFAHTQRWPKSARFVVTQRLQGHVLDVIDELVQARYERRDRAARLARANLRLERMRHLLRLAKTIGVCPARTFTGAMRRLDEIGRMLHGWRARLGGEAAP